jgi:hypothetical protein
MYATLQYSHTAKQSLRPWVGAIGIDQATPNGDSSKQQYTLVADKEIEIEMDLKNFGNSPALRVTSHMHALLGNPPPQTAGEWTPDTIPEYDCRSNLKRDFGPMFPAGSSNSWYTDREEEARRPSFSVPEFKDVVTGTKGFYLMGCLKYEDQWGTTHHTDYCFYLNHVAGSATGSLSFCATGNYAD